MTACSESPRSPPRSSEQLTNRGVVGFLLCNSQGQIYRKAHNVKREWTLQQGRIKRRMHSGRVSGKRLRAQRREEKVGARSDQGAWVEESGASRVVYQLDRTKRSRHHVELVLSVPSHNNNIFSPSMETLTTAHAQGQLGIPVPGVDKDFEMHPSGPSAVNPATRMPPPLPVKPADHEQSQSQEKEVASLQAEAVGFGSRVSPGVESLHPTSPSISQTQVQDDASQPEPRLGSPEDQSNSQTEPKTTPARHKRTASGILKAVDTPSDVRPRAESVSSSGSKAGEVSLSLS